MRIWTVHPKYLDSRGLVALWRETLLAQKVLAGKTRGYRHHPQLERFKAQADPRAAIACYLWHVADEAMKRGYSFDTRRINRPRAEIVMKATSGQLAYEWQHLLAKLAVRDPERLTVLSGLVRPRAHPMFRMVSGSVADWERE